MKTFNKNILFIYLGLLFYLLINLVFKLENNSVYNFYINPIVWLAILIGIMFIVKDDNARVKDKYGKFQTLFIASILYLMVYFSLGLVFGYERSPYSHQLFLMIRNVISFISVVVIKEKIRSILVNYTSDKLKYNLLIVILFILINLNFATFISSFNGFDTAFKYIFGTFIPLCVGQTLFTYLVKKCGFVALLSFVLPIELSYILLPIFPRLDWFVLGLYTYISYFMIFLTIRHEYSDTSRVSKRKTSSSVLAYLPLIVGIIIFISFVMGLFKYRPLAIVSNSMVPVFARGDIVVVKNIKYVSIADLKIGDIIEYQLDDSLIVHRIIEIKQNNGVTYFRTKGDNNNAPDTKYVSEKQVTGLVKMYVPKVGYPTVWLSDLFKKGRKPDVEMG